MNLIYINAIESDQKYVTTWSP